MISHGLRIVKTDRGRARRFHFVPNSCSSRRPVTPRRRHGPGRHHHGRSRDRTAAAPDARRSVLPPAIHIQRSIPNPVTLEHSPPDHTMSSRGRPRRNLRSHRRLQAEGSIIRIALRYRECTKSSFGFGLTSSDPRWRNVTNAGSEREKRRRGAPRGAPRPWSAGKEGQRSLVPSVSHTSTVPRFSARIGCSILERSPATTTVTALGVSLARATRAMSAAVTAATRSR